MARKNSCYRLAWIALCTAVGCKPAANLQSPTNNAATTTAVVELAALVDKPVQLVGIYDERWKDGATVIISGQEVHLGYEVESDIANFHSPAVGGANFALNGSTVSVTGILRAPILPTPSPTSQDARLEGTGMYTYPYYIEHPKMHLIRRPATSPGNP